MKSTIAIVTLLCSIGAAHAAITVAEHTLPSNASSWFNVGAGMATDGAVFDNRQAQTFIPTTSGFLEDISFNLYRQASSDADLRVSVTNLISGQPAGTLASMLLSFSSVGTSSLSSTFLRSGSFSHTVTPSGSLFLSAGVTYALVFASDTTEANYRIYGDRSGYADGANLRFQNSGPYEDGSSSDLLFRVTANPIPEPHAVALLGVSSLLLALRRQRCRTSQLIQRRDTSFFEFRLATTGASTLTFARKNAYVPI